MATENKVLNSKILEPVELAEGVYWIGYFQEKDLMQNNPYMIVEENEVLIIDAGSRLDFSNVVLNILQTGINPSQIENLIYQSFTPDICGSLPNFEQLIENKNLKIISQKQNNLFIRCYSENSPINCIEQLNFEFKFKTGRLLRFIKTPYCQTSGSFVTYDTKSKILFTSNLFSSYRNFRELFLDKELIRVSKEEILESILDFHKINMGSKKALLKAIKKLKNLPVNMIAPQHGNIIRKREQVEWIIKNLEEIDCIGIDCF